MRRVIVALACCSLGDAWLFSLWKGKDSNKAVAVSAEEVDAIMMNLEPQDMEGSSVRGVAKRDESRYSGLKFKCDEGSAEIGLERVNDDYCDCDDGSDEPGTSACAGQPGSTFFCSNDNHRPMFIPSSRVFDGVCDCCDGSDEADGFCGNTCLEDGAAYREALAERKVAVEQGLVRKNEYIAKAQAAFADKPEVKRDIAGEIKALESAVAKMEEQIQNLNDLQSKMTKIEERSFNRERAKYLLLERLNRIQLEDLVVNLLIELEGTHGVESTLLKLVEEALESHAEEVVNVAVSVDGTAEETKVQDHRPRWVEKEEIKSMRENEKVETEEGSDGLSADLEKISEQLTSMEETAQDARNTLHELRKERDSTNDDRNTDYGPERVWWALRSECFKVEADGYSYEMCPFQKAMQNSISLGSWEGFREGSDYKILLFTGGTKCWNGPQRSLTVFAKCGAEEKILSVSEPSMCEYAMDFITPAAC